MEENMELNVDEANELDSPNVKPTIGLKLPSEQTRAKIAGVAKFAGKGVFTAAKGALNIARIGANLASKGVQAISKTEIFQESVSTLLTIASTVAIMPVAATIGIANKALLGKRSNFVENVHSWNKGINTLTTPLVKDVLSPLLGLSSKIIDKVTEKKLSARIAEATGGEFSIEQLAGLFSGGNRQAANTSGTPNIDNIEDATEYMDALMSANSEWQAEQRMEDMWQAGDR